MIPTTIPNRTWSYQYLINEPYLYQTGPVATAPIIPPATAPAILAVSIGTANHASNVITVAIKKQNCRL